MNSGFADLHPYPFARLDALLKNTSPPTARPTLRLSLGEPQHDPPELVLQALVESLNTVKNYPLTKGSVELRQAQSDWMRRRYRLRELNHDRHVLPVNGTREGLFAIAQTLIDAQANSLVAMPNPFYQLYEGASLLAGAKPLYLHCDADQGFLPDPEDISDAEWQRLRLIYLCTPGNPSGGVINHDLFKVFIERAQEFDLVIVSDECYSEIYPQESKPPGGILEVCEAIGLGDYHNCLSMHSLSKRSNLPGLRSGFVAGDAALIAKFSQYRSYHGCAMPPHHQAASVIAWSDEEHVRENRELYRRKFTAVREILSPHFALDEPDGGFFYWLKTPVDDQEFVRTLYAEAGVLLLPGSFLGRESSASAAEPTVNPGSGRARMALVPALEDCIEAARRMAEVAARWN
ncbi:MAG: succinyldiaminopimelate transaminase [Pseudomonadota bacterium]